MKQCFQTFLLVFLTTVSFAAVRGKNEIADELNKAAYYKAMQGSSRALVDSQLSKLKASTFENKKPFEGALLMKKAGLGGAAPTKLHLFKEGHKLLDEAIKQNPDNAEYRFLRLMIQENAPGFLGYNNDIEKDSQILRKSYKSLPADVQQAVEDYNKKSKVLKLDLS